MVYYIFVAVMLIVCFYVIYELEQLSNEASDQIPDIQCPSTIDALAANLDASANFTVRNGDFHCFCKNLYSKSGLEVM